MRLDEWQKYLESQFLDETDDKPPDLLRITSPTGLERPGKNPPENSRPESEPNSDNWIPARSAFGVAGLMISANVSVHSHTLHNNPISTLDEECPHYIGNNATELQPKRRNRRRTRVGRCVPPENSRRTGFENESEVPFHVRLLLDLRSEGRADDLGVAQYSYKRPFQETRQELIARLIDPVITLEEAARLLNVCPTTVRRYTNRGLLNYYRKPTGSGDVTVSPDRETRQRKFRLSDILTFLKNQECDSVAP